MFVVVKEPGGPDIQSVLCSPGPEGDRDGFAISNFQKGWVGQEERPL